MMKRIEASNSSIAAGRDVTVNINVSQISDLSRLIHQIEHDLNLEAGTLESIIDKNQRNTPSDVLRLLPILTRMGGLIEDASDERGAFLSPLPENDMSLENIEKTALIQQAAVSVTRYQFGEAYAGLSKLAKLVSPQDPQYLEIRKSQLVSGLIKFGCDNQISKLQELFGEISVEEHLIEGNPEIACLAADILQEICTRKTSHEGLESACNLLLPGYSNSSGKQRAYLGNSLGLAYRRLGERNRENTLDDSIAVLEKSLELVGGDSFLEADIRNNLAIALIRKFEANGDELLIQSARKLLMNGLETICNSTDPRVFMLKPKLLNNMGNTYKQEARSSACVLAAKRAIDSYHEAEMLWSSETAPYEWAMLQKNIAASLVIYGSLTRDAKELEKALVLADKSTKYRTISDSPIQWGQSVIVVASAIQELANVKGGQSNVPKRITSRLAKHVRAFRKYPAFWELDRDEKVFSAVSLFESFQPIVEKNNLTKHSSRRAKGARG